MVVSPDESPDAHGLDERVLEAKRANPAWYHEWDGSAAGAVAYPTMLAKSFTQRIVGNFGREFTITLVSVYLMKGAVYGFVSAGQLPYFKKYMKISGEMYQQYGTIASTPWSCKPLIGACSDAIPILGYNKRYYIVAGVLVGMVSFIILIFCELSSSQAWIAALLFFAANLMVATVDLLCEGKYAEKMASKPHTGSDLVTWVWLFVSLGGLVASCLTGPIADKYSPKVLYMICLPLTIQALIPTLMGWLGEEKRVMESCINTDIIKERPKMFLLSILMSLCALGLVGFNLWDNPVALLVYTVTVSVVLNVLAQLWLPKVMARCNLYLFLSSALYISVPGAQDYYYTADEACVPGGPHFSYTFYQTYTMIIGSVVSVVGVFIFQSYLSKFKIRFAFWTTTFLGIAGSVFDIIIVKRWNLAWGISDEFMYMLGDAIISNALSMLNFMPAVTLTSKLCPKGAEATVYAMLASFQNFGSQVSRSLGSFTMQYVGIKTTVPCDFSALPMTLFVVHMVIPMICVPLTFVLIPDAYFHTDFTDLIDDNKPTDEDDSLLGMSGEDMLKKRSSGKRQPASYGSLEYFDE